MAEGKISKSKHIFLYLRIAFVLCGIGFGIYWVSRGQRWSNLTKLFLQMNLWVFAAALGIFVIGQIIVSLRWWLLLRTQSIFIEFWAAVRLHFLGLFYNNFMPSSVGGDLIRAWYVTRHTDRRFEAALSVFVDRAIGLLSTLTISGFFYIIFLRGHGVVKTSDSQGGFLKSVAEYSWIFLGVAVGIAVILGLLLLHRKGRLIMVKAWSYIRMLGTRMIKKLKDSIAIYCRKPLVLIAAFGLTVFLQILVITGFWFLGVNLGIDASVKYYYVFFTLTWVLGAVPISIGGAVVVEFSLATLFVKFAGVAEEAAGALALCQRAVWMLASLVGAVIHLLGAHLPKDFFIDSGKSID
ncbi:MAG: lysylphosphatidylglycerol synthase transmembrane domain-containing protein [Planctomycetota bacterium]